MDGLDALKILFGGKVEEKETGAVTIVISGIWGLFDILEGHYNCLLHNDDDSVFRLSRDGKCVLCKLISMFCNNEISAYVFNNAFDEVANTSSLLGGGYITIFAKYLDCVAGDDWEKCKILFTVSDLDKSESDIFATLHDLGYTRGCENA